MTLSVVVVDDDPLVTAGLEVILGSDDDLSLAARCHDGQTAVETARQIAPDVVLVDLRMPGLGGVETTRRLRQLAQPPAVVILTTFDTDVGVLAALSAGACGYVLKHSPPQNLLQAVRDAAAGHAILAPSHTRLLLDRYRNLRDEEQPDQHVARRAVAVLTPREREVVSGVARGLSNAAIGAELSCSPATVKAHLGNVFEKLGVVNRVQLALIGHRAGLADG